MNAVNDTSELSEAELELVAGGAPTHYEFGQSYDWTDLESDMVTTIGYPIPNY